MSRKFRIAIPSDDGTSIVRNFGESRGFLVITIDKSGIHTQEMRWNLLSEMLTSDLGSHYNLFDCDLIMVDQISNCHCRRLEARKKKILRTNQNSVDYAVDTYLKGEKSMK